MSLHVPSQAYARASLPTRWLVGAGGADVPVDCLSAAQIAGYGRYGEAPSARQLERFCHFDARRP